MNELMKFSKFM
jgi:hypothetical protein